jgi:electron-transferring-flavoprotein dehydrogenase
MHNDGNYVVSLGAVVKWLADPGRGAGRRDLPRLHGRRSAVHRRGPRCAASPPATWASARTASRTTASSSAWSCEASTRCSPKARAATWAAADRALRTLTRAATRRASRSASRSCGRSTAAARPGRAWSCTPPAGRWTSTPSAAASSTTSRATACHAGPRGRAGLPEPLAQPVRGDAALEDPPGDPRHIEGGKRIGYGARAINGRRPAEPAQAGVPRRCPGRLRRRHMNAARIKGSHAAIKTGMLAAEALAPALAAGRSHDELVAYPAGFEKQLAGTRSCTRRATSSTGSSRATPSAR